ncbi:MAG: 2-C-methyl-D-erythritol 4-phosphate cytidylyltransferase [Actinobacteria bacterium]|nr:2-C-methyl-D-erythritol 4-phosphate cytidylyltransferase [Actinomycetota bacterium]
MAGAVAIVLAAGRGERLDPSLPKALVQVGGRTIVARGVGVASGCRGIDGVVVVAPAGFEDAVAELVRPFGVSDVVTGGATRQASVRAALDAVPAGIRAIVCHDAARPFATAELFERAMAALDGWNGVVPTLPVVDTLKRLAGERIEGTEPRGAFALAQTPQVFEADALRAAHEAALRDGVEATDDAALLERAGYRIRAIDGERLNLKITTWDDVRLAEAIGGSA